MPVVHAFQILNHYTRPEDLDPGFGTVDNSGNERPDWYEYWPIRRFLLNQPLDENAFYGFLSPKFRLKTNLTAADVTAVIGAAAEATDVVLFSPSIHKSAYFLNVFEHGDAEHPGLMATAKRFFAHIGRPSALEELVSDSRNTVHSNYFIARPRFWRAWLDITERMFELAERMDDPLGESLRESTNYRGKRDVQMKIFLMERVATWLLITSDAFKAEIRDPFAARTRIYKLPLAIICDALKIAYTTQRRGQYKDVFMLVRRLSGYWTWQIKVGGAVGWDGIRPTLSKLQSYWTKTPT